MNNLLLFLFLGEAVVVFLFFFLALKSFYESEKVLLDKGVPLESEIKRYTTKKEHKGLKILKTTLSTIIFGSLLCVTGVIALCHYDRNAINYFGSTPIAIQTGSMSKKNEKNTYLVENNLNTQFNAGSIILLDKIPAKENLKRYDVIGYYNSSDTLIVHRLVDFGVVDQDGNFTATETTAEATHFLFRGDANTSKDPYFVTYDQMYGIYKNYHIDALGYVVNYVQSYFGLISIIGICSVVFAEDYYSRKTDKAYKEYIAKNIKLLPLKENLSKSEETNISPVITDELENVSIEEEIPNQEVIEDNDFKEISNDDLNLEEDEEESIYQEDETSERDEVNQDDLVLEENSSDEENYEDEPSKEREDLEIQELEESESKAKVQEDETKSKEEISSSEFKDAKKDALKDKDGKNYKAKKLEEKEKKKKAFLIKKEEQQKKKDAKKTAHRLNR